MTGAQVGLISKNADGLSYGYTRADDVVVVFNVFLSIAADERDDVGDDGE